MAAKPLAPVDGARHLQSERVHQLGKLGARALEIGPDPLGMRTIQASEFADELDHVQALLARRR